MILHIPHASTFIPDDVVFLKPDISQDIERMTDWDTDRLFGHHSAERITCPVSRLVCDVERFPFSDPMEKHGMGVCYTHDSFGTEFKTVTEAHRTDIMERFYEPHHAALTTTVRRLMGLFDFIVIVDCHSFSPEVLPHEEDAIRPDFCVGTDPFHTPDELVQRVSDIILESGHTIGINRPFAGTLVPLEFFQKESRIKSIMIEVNRGLYRGDHANWDATKRVLDTILNAVYAYECQTA